MTHFRNQLSGVYAAALTPLLLDYSPDLDGMARLLAFLAGRGCHGALILGTTGEGPSFGPADRLALMQAAARARRDLPGFRLLVGTGTPALDETIDLTRAAFDLGLEGVVVLPPYYYKKAGDDGLFAWFAAVLRAAVPSGSALFGYHIPAVSGVGLSLDLLARLKDAFPNRFAGIKDSTGDPEHARQLGQRFGPDLVVLTGNDRLLSLALENHAAGCITAMANLASPDLRTVWDAFQAGRSETQVQARLDAARAVMDRYPPAPPLLKALLARLHGLPHWPVRPPLLALDPLLESQALAALQGVPGLAGTAA